jgi:hypothetical protein
MQEKTLHCSTPNPIETPTKTINFPLHFDNSIFPQTFQKPLFKLAERKNGCFWNNVAAAGNG